MEQKAYFRIQIKRIRNGLAVTVICIFFFIQDLDALKVLISIAVGFIIFKLDYYDVEDIKKIVVRTSKVYDNIIPEDACGSPSPICPFW